MSIPKPAHKSTTIQALVGVMAASTVAFLGNPANWGKGAECAKVFEQEGLSRDLSAIAQVIPLVLAPVGIFGRFRVGDIWTPVGVPGPDKKDVVQGQRYTRRTDDPA